MMKVSIVTINKNNAQGLRSTIESVVQQTYKEKEYLVIDGGSNDGSIEVLKEFKNNISYWISENDKGVYHAMNKGIKKATGTYCLFLNSGDFLADNSVIEQIISENKNESIIYGNLLKIFSNGKKLIDKNNAGKQITMLNFFTGTLNHSCSLIKRELFEKYGFYDESLKIVADWKFFIQTVGMNNESVAYKDIVVSVFNMEGISNTNHELEKSEREKVLKEILPYSVYLDYEMHSSELKKLQRINRYGWTKLLFRLMERIVFKYEKWMQRYLNS